MIAAMIEDSERQIVTHVPKYMLSVFITQCDQVIVSAMRVDRKKNPK